MNKTIPKAYKQSEAGIIPEDWEVRSFAYSNIKVIDGDRGKEYPKKSDYQHSGFCVFLNTKNVTTSGFLFEVVNFISKTKDELLKNGKLQREDIILTTRGSVGNIAYYDNSVQHENLRINSGMVLLRLGNNIINRYFYIFLKSIYFKNQIKTLSYGSAQLQLTVRDILNLKILLPPLQEQQKIAEILTTWDKAIATQQKLISTQQQLKKGLMQQLLTGKTRFPEFSSKWQEVKLGDICDIKKGEQVNKNTLKSQGDYPVINGGINPSGYSKNWNTEANNITISEGGNSCGYVNFINKKFWNGGHSYTFSNLQIYKLFLYQFLKLKQNNIMKLRVGSGLPNIQKRDIDKFIIHKPDFQEQQKIAKVLSLADDEITQRQKELEQLKQQKKALMQQLLTGKVRTSHIIHQRIKK